MTCDQMELRMAELLAGEIAPEDRSALERHLLDCASCRGDFELARAGARIEWADVAVPKEVIESTLASFREPPPSVRFLRWATAAAAAFGVAALLLTSSRASQKTEDPPAVAVRRAPVLAMVQQDAAVGALVAKDEEGRPVGELGLKSHEVTVEILDGIAKTTVEENFENHTNRRLEGTFLFPLPSDASISRLALEVNGKIEEGTCLERERAREVFESIVRKAMDPALLEWQPGGFFKCRVFPIEPRSTKRVIVAYTQALPCFQGKMTYVYPLASEKTRTHPPGEASIAVQARFSGGLTKIESPSHHLDVQRKNPNEASMSFRAKNYRPNNDFVVTLEPGDEEIRVVSHKTDGDDGYFACIAVPRGGGARAPGRYAFVIDASASTSAPRLEVAKRLVRAMMERRIDGDRFEIIAHNIGVERSGEVDLRAANDFMDRLRPIGGSDVLQALLAAGDAEAIYIGKGSATFGETEPSKILEALKGRRIRAIAVGSDANGALLERLGGMMRVSPNDDVTKRVTEIAATLGSPVLSDVKVEGGDAVYDVVGVRDLFYGERLIVSGRYRGPTAKLVITGRGYRREVDVVFPAKEEGNNYVRRLWAQRKVSDLLAQGPATKAAVTDLGVKYQIMTPYTSFLVLETEQMWKDFQLKREVQKQDEVLSKKMAEAEEVAKPTVVPLAPTVVTVKPPTPAPTVSKEPELKPKAKDVLNPEQGRRDRLEKSIELSTDIPDTETTSLVVRTPNKFRSAGDRFEREGRFANNQTGGLQFSLGESTGQVGAGFSAQETARLESWKEAVGQSARSAQDWDGYLSVFFTLDHDPHTGPVDALDIDGKLKGKGFSNTPDLFWSENGEGVPRGIPGRLNGKAARLNDLQRNIDDSNTLATKYEADMQVFARQLEVQLSQIQELTTKVDEHRAKLAKSLNEKSLAVGEMQYLRDQVEKLSREKESLEEKLSAAAQTGGAERKPVQDMGVRALKMRNIAPPAAYTAKLEPGKSIHGTPLESPQEELMGRWALTQQLEALLTKDASGRTLGKLNYDPQTNTFIVRDTPEVLERVARVVEAVDRAAGGESQAAALQKLLQQREAEERREFEERKKAADQAGGNVGVAPKKALEAKVTAVANEIGLVVISIGKDDGVLEGDEFSVDRGGGQVARIIIDRTDRKWSAGKVVAKRMEPRVADDVSTLSPRTDGKFTVEAATGDGSWIAIPTNAGAVGQILAVTREGKFVALIQVRREGEARVYAGLASGRVLPGDDVAIVNDPRAYYLALPADVRSDLASRANQQTIRAKMGLKE